MHAAIDRKLEERRRALAGGPGANLDLLAAELATLSERLRVAKTKSPTVRTSPEGIDQSMIAQIEGGHRPLPEARRDEFERVLGLPDDELRMLAGDAPRGPRAPYRKRTG